jgi:hypothetical protein
MKKLLFLAALAATAISAPATANAASFKGIVVAKQNSRHALVVASRGGVVRTVRARTLRARPGSRVSVSARRLGDGTFRAARVAAHGRVHHVRIRAVVVRRLRGGLLVSAGHSMLRLRTARRTAAAGGGSNPKPGDVIETTVTIQNDGELDEDDMDEVGHENVVEVEGKVVSFDATTIVIQPEEGGPITITIPNGFTLPTSLKAGDKVEAKASVNGTTLTLVKLKSEDDEDDNNDDDNGDDDGGSGDE